MIPSTAKEITDGGLPSTTGSPSFVAHDWCGWNEQYGRFTHCPSGATLVCQAWMGQSDWDKAQLEWFEKLDGELIVHKCPTGPYRETGNAMGSVSEIVAKLRSRFPENKEIPHP